MRNASSHTMENLITEKLAIVVLKNAGVMLRKTDLERRPNSKYHMLD